MLDGPALAAFDSDLPATSEPGDVLDLGEPLGASDLSALPAPVPLPLKAPLTVPPGAFVRFHLETTVEAGKPPASIGGLTVVGV